MNKEKEKEKKNKFLSLNDVNSDIYILHNVFMKDYIDERFVNCKMKCFKNDAKISGSMWNIFDTLVEQSSNVVRAFFSVELFDKKYNKDLEKNFKQAFNHSIIRKLKSGKKTYCFVSIKNPIKTNKIYQEYRDQARNIFVFNDDLHIFEFHDDINENNKYFDNEIIEVETDERCVSLDKSTPRNFIINLMKIYDIEQEELLDINVYSSPRMWENYKAYFLESYCNNLSFKESRCQICKKDTKDNIGPLERAHCNLFDRKDLLKSAIECLWENENTIIIVKDIWKKFIENHKNSAIFMLCKKCHNEYDNKYKNHKR